MTITRINRKCPSFWSETARNDHTREICARVQTKARSQEATWSVFFFTQTFEKRKFSNPKLVFLVPLLLSFLFLFLSLFFGAERDTTRRSGRELRYRPVGTEETKKKETLCFPRRPPCCCFALSRKFFGVARVCFPRRRRRWCRRQCFRAPLEK